MEKPCRSQAETLAELEQKAPNAPFLALGQTIFWDETMKAGVVLASQKAGYPRTFVAGVHDTDYFAKSPVRSRKGEYKALPHNDTTTKGLWSAAGEFSSLFGSETVITREQLQKAGAKVAKVAAERPGYLDEATEAYGWRGIASLQAEPQITAEKPLGPLFSELYKTLDWAVEESLGLLSGPAAAASHKKADEIRSVFCDEWDRSEDVTLAEFYERLLPKFYSLTAGEPVDVETTRTTSLLRFNTETCDRARFDLVGLFLNPMTRGIASESYNAAVSGSEMYTLDRFGTGALPFDVFVPGHGRGTLRLGNRGGVIMTPTPIGFSFRQPIRCNADLAAVLEKRFGPDCVLIGKAVSLIGMLAREFVFVFHHGASSYVWRSRKMHQALAERGHPLPLNPILRVKYEPWDALAECAVWFRLPEPLKRPFGVEELSASSLALRWRQVAARQKERLELFGALKRPKDLIEFLQREIGGQWACIGAAHEALHQTFDDLNRQLGELRGRKRALLAEMKVLSDARIQAEIESGRHWREFVFEKSATPQILAERERLQTCVQSLIHQMDEKRTHWRQLQDEQEALVESDGIVRAREQRQEIGFEAELMRMTLIREAVIASQGLENAGHRPAGWWMPLVSPDGEWFHATIRRAQFCLEELN
jgi:hypothetical protein